MKLAYMCDGPESAVEHAHRCLEIAENLDNESSRALAYGALGFACLLNGQLAAVRDALGKFAAIVRDHGTMRVLLPEDLAILAEAHLALGEGGESVEAARESIELARAGGCPYYEAQAQLALVATLLTTAGASTGASSVTKRSVN